MLSVQLPRSKDPQQIRVVSFYHLVGKRLQRWWNFHAKPPCGNEVDDQFEFRRLLHRQFSRLLASEYPSSIDPRQTPRVRDPCPITYQPAIKSELAGLE